MPADRLIEIQVQAEGAYVDGEWAPGSVTSLRVYGSRRDRTARDIEEEGGQRLETRRDWRIRCDSRIAAATVENLIILDGMEKFDVLNMVEVTRQRGGAPDLRRRFLDIQGVYSR